MLKQRLRNRAIGWELDFDALVSDVIEAESDVILIVVGRAHGSALSLSERAA